MKSSEELGKALKNKEDILVIEGDLRKRVIKIRATGKIAWAIAIGCIGLAFFALATILTSAGTSSVVAIPSELLLGTAASTILGYHTAVSALAISIAAGGVHYLDDLREYEKVSDKDNVLILRRKHK